MITSFSIKDANTKDISLISEIQTHCKANGISMGFVIVKALREYWEKQNVSK